MVCRFVFSGVAGYVLVHFNKTRSLQPASFRIRTASSISESVAAPVLMMTGFPVVATFLSKGQSVFSKEAILYNGTCKLSRKSTAVSSKGELKATSPNSAARLKIGACQSQGV